MGDVLTIRGSGFGSEKNESYITIDNAPPTSSAYISWSDGEILVKTPEFGDAGLVYVYRGKRKSNPALFANEATIPAPFSPETGSGPRIASIEPASASVGSLITIQGGNFGPSRENSGFFFSWNAESSGAAPHGIYSPDYIEVSETEFGYESWSEREIRVRIPDGAASGNLELRTPKGNSPPVYFEISGKPGTKIFKDKRNYTLSYTVDVKIDKAALPNALYIWMPHPVVSSCQRNIRLLSRTEEPFIEKCRGTSLFQFIDILPKTGRNITISYAVEVYAVETNITNQNPVRLNKPSQAGSFYILQSAFIPSENPGIKAKVSEIIGREQLPYAKARKIYDWLISNIRIEGVPLSGGALEALEEKRADSYRASLLFCALARAAEIPAIPVAGVLVNRQRDTVKHYWGEFWLDGFGWIPLDPALGAGAAPEDFNLREDHALYYFGSLDNQRVAFSRGERFLSQMAPRGRTILRNREYSLQNLWEEAVGGLDSYSSLWSDVTITGAYAQ
jgi:hypothetical protein